MCLCQSNKPSELKTHQNHATKGRFDPRANTYRVKAGDPEYEELDVCQIVCGKYVTLKHLRGRREGEGGGEHIKDEITPLGLHTSWIYQTPR